MLKVMVLPAFKVVCVIWLLFLIGHIIFDWCVVR